MLICSFEKCASLNYVLRFDVIFILGFPWFSIETKYWKIKEREGRLYPSQMYGFLINILHQRILTDILYQRMLKTRDKERKTRSDIIMPTCGCLEWCLTLRVVLLCPLECYGDYQFFQVCRMHFALFGNNSFRLRACVRPSVKLVVWNDAWHYTSCAALPSWVQRQCAIFSIDSYAYFCAFKCIHYAFFAIFFKNKNECVSLILCLCVLFLFSKIQLLAYSKSREGSTWNSSAVGDFLGWIAWRS